jgi:hypothetical protein
MESRRGRQSVGVVLLLPMSRRKLGRLSSGAVEHNPPGHRFHADVPVQQLHGRASRGWGCLSGLLRACQGSLPPSGLATGPQSPPRTEIRYCGIPVAADTVVAQKLTVRPQPDWRTREVPCHAFGLAAPSTDSKTDARKARLNEVGHQAELCGFGPLALSFVPADAGRPDTAVPGSKD